MGRVQLKEFSQYINSANGPKLGKERTQQLYNRIVKGNPSDGFTFQDLVGYFEKERVIEAEESRVLSPAQISGMSVDDFLSLQQVVHTLADKENEKLMMKD